MANYKKGSKQSNTLVPNEGTGINKVADALTLVAWIVYAFYFIIGLLCALTKNVSSLIEGAGFVLLLVFWFTGLTKGSIILGIAEVIKLLQIRTEQGYVLPESAEISKSQNAGINNVEQAVQIKDSVTKTNIPPKTNNASSDAAVVLKTPDGKIACPNCGAIQMSDRSQCYKCGAKFEYTD